MSSGDLPQQMVWFGLFWWMLGAWRWVVRPEARLQAKIWILVGSIFVLLGWIQLR
jgi:hypothetical protein